MEKILLVEDDSSLRDVLTTVLENDGFAVTAQPDAESAISCLRKDTYSVVLSDFKLPEKNGIDLLREVREFSKNLPFIIMTAYGTIDIATTAMKLGANDFIAKPFEPEDLSRMLNDVIHHRRILDRTNGTRTRRERSFLGEDPAILKLLHQAKKVARVDTSVLILGESGTGKELVARYIHEHSPRSDKPFVAVNCAAMPAELLESEFFGHESGAFTGATQTRKGVFEVAAEGTVFLDEVGDMAPHLQVKLLRALQEKEIKRVGGNQTIKVAPRIIAATNHSIDDSIKKGNVREDFYFRIAVVTFTIPPLRDRSSDIDLLANHYLSYFCQSIGRETLKIDAAARALLHQHTWPGNARELENVIERAVIMADTAIRPEHLGITLESTIESVEDSTMTLMQISQIAARKAETEVISRTLKRTGGNKLRAAKILGVSYKTLLNKIKEYELGGPIPVAVEEGV